MKFIRIYLILSVTLLYTISSAYRILGVFPYNSKSHNIVFQALMKGLARHGHRVDVISHFPLKQPLNNYTDIMNLDGSLKSNVDNFTIEYATQVSGYGNLVNVIALFDGNRVCHLMGSKEFQDFIKNTSKNSPYDLVITEAFSANCFMGLGYVFKVPVVAVSSAVEYPWVSDFTGNLDNLAIVPNAFQISAGKMSFFERVKNVFSHHLQLHKFHSLTEESQTSSMRKYLSPDIPHIRDVEKNVALTLVNSHPILFGVKPITPALVQIAGLHIEEGEQNLLPDLKEWMDNSHDGIVYFTFGSMVLIETLPKKVLNDIYISFTKIAPVKVLMKIVDVSKLPPGLPDNVKTLSWIPQQSVLAHRNVKVFITHGGLGGLQEALHYGVPMIGIPLFCDQFYNVENFVIKGMMIRINFDEFSGPLLDSALEQLLHNPGFKAKATYYSALFRDRPMKPLDNAIYWIEYVIRNGPDILKSPALKFTWWELALLDVYGAFLIVVVLATVIIIVCLSLSFKKLKQGLKPSLGESLKLHWHKIHKLRKLISITDSKLL